MKSRQKWVGPMTAIGQKMALLQFVYNKFATLIWDWIMCDGPMLLADMFDLSEETSSTITWVYYAGKSEWMTSVKPLSLDHTSHKQLNTTDCPI